jgi:drug/metabolite transporter (DMT)-like permease
MAKRSKEFWLVIFSFFIIYIVWGSTYLANAWGIKSVPPFLFAGFRFVVAGILLLGISRLFGAIAITKQQFKNTVISGVFLFTIGNGLVVWSLQYINSGIAALFVAFQPLIVAMMLWKMKNEKPKRETWIGIGLGLFGMFLLVGQPHFVTSTSFLLGTIAILIALFAWGYISIWIPDADLPKSIMQSAAFQMITGGMGLLLFSVIIGELKNFHIENFNTTTFWSFSYLVVFGSIIAFSSFNYLLKAVSPTKVVTSAYVNPVVALIIGWWLNNESLSPQSLIAAIVLLTGVVFITLTKSRKRRRTFV